MAAALLVPAIFACLHPCTLSLGETLGVGGGERERVIMVVSGGARSSHLLSRSIGVAPLMTLPFFLSFFLSSSAAGEV